MATYNPNYFVSFTLLPLALLAQPNESVEKVNGKLDAAYGNLNSSTGRMASGSATFPFADTLGFQFDTLYTRADSAEFKGLGGHIFRRDHEKYLLGLTFGGLFGERVDSLELGLEGEYYYKWFTLGARAGLASIEYDNPAPFIETKKKSVFGQIQATAYPLENLSISVILENRFDNFSAQIDAEYQLPIDGLSLYCRNMRAEHDYEHNLVGLRYYFGGAKSLKQRHRRDDPRNIVNDLFFGVGTYGAEYNKLGKQYAREQIAVGNVDEGRNSNSYGSYGSTSVSIGHYPIGDFEAIGPEDE